MTLIPCSDPCIYQQDGCCTLARAGSGGTPAEGIGCIHFVPRQTSSQKDRQRLPHILDRDQL